MKQTRLPLGMVMALLVHGNVAHAQINGSWIALDNGHVWSDATKWSTNPDIPGGAESIVTIGSNIPAFRSVTIDTTPRTVGIFNFGNPEGTGSFTLQASGGGKLIFDNGASAAQLNAVGNSAGNTITAPIELLSDLIIDNSNPLAISGVGGTISGNHSVTKTGAGQLTFSHQANNTFTGGFTLDGGDLGVTHNSGFGTGTVTIKSGALLTTGGSRFYANNLILDGDFSNLDSGGGSNTFNGTTATLQRDVNINVAQNFGINNAIGDGDSDFGITKNGSATLSLGGNNSYGGGFTLNGGIVHITGSSGVNTAFGSGTLTLNGGGISSTQLRVISNDVTIGGDVSLNSASVTMRYIGAITLTGDRVVSNVGSVSFVDGVNHGVIGESGGSFSLTKEGAGNMTLGSGNSYTGGTIIKSGTLILATDSLANSGDVHVDGGALVLNNNVSDTVAQVKLTKGIIAGSTATSILTAAGYEVEEGTITAVLAGNTAAFVKNGSGLVQYGGATSNTYGGGTTLNSGTLRLANNNRLPDTGILSVAGGVLDLNGFGDTVANVAMSGGTITSGTLFTTSLSVTGAGGAIAANTLVNVSGVASVESGASLNVSGTLAGAGTHFNVAGELSGSGFVNKTVVVQEGGTLSPGNSPGVTAYSALELHGGGNYNWQVYDATGLAGVGFDTISVSGVLDLSGLSLDSPYAINLWSLSAIGPDVNGAAINFDGLLDDQQWVLISASSIDLGSLSEPIGSYFSVFTSANNGTAGFANTFYGTFSVDVVGNDLVLHYAVPEPSTYVLAALGALGFTWMLRRRRVA